MGNASVDNSVKKSGLKNARLRAFLELCLSACELGHRTVHLSVVADDEIQALNRQWRSKDKPTDVLSFSQVEAAADDGFPMDVFPGPQPLGDIIISFETAARQAREIGHSVDQEYQRLIVHGFLHLLGHDHVNGGRQAAKMKREEERLLSYLDQRLEA